jgi:hypothetical protein
MLSLMMMFALGCSSQRVDESGLTHDIEGFSIYLTPNDIPGILDPGQSTYVGIIMERDTLGNDIPCIFQVHGTRKGFMDSVYYTYTRARPLMEFRAGFQNKLLVPNQPRGKIFLYYTELPKNSNHFGYFTVEQVQELKKQKWSSVEYLVDNRMFDISKGGQVVPSDIIGKIIDIVMTEYSRWSNTPR